ASSSSSLPPWRWRSSGADACRADRSPARSATNRASPCDRRPQAWRGDLSELVIATENLTRRFGDFVAVRGVGLRVERGTFYGFLGPNGAGKSTTIKMLTGLLAPTSGKMIVLGQDLADRAAALEVKRRIGVVPEDLALFDNLTAREYLTFVGRMYLV